MGQKTRCSTFHVFFFFFLLLLLFFVVVVLFYFIFLIGFKVGATQMQPTSMNSTCRTFCWLYTATGEMDNVNSKLNN